MRLIDANLAMRKIREYMENYPNATTRIAACRACLSILGDKQQVPTIDPAAQSPRWIPVTERLPEKDKDVLVYATTKFIGGSKIAIDKLEEGECHPIWIYTHGWFEVTHWMPLPDLPKATIK